ncbi:sensor histidine kinase [Paenibacillus humicola]|uniref:sensor histidine kinase n=1 Tax=Paenibacillus humicola TaxID=3110540 RepID=UPI00237AB705|nr:ATP-binding protein [Paenibacillus humicola]
MRKNSVVLKLFVVTSVMILLVYSLVMLAEGLFFERFYRLSKVHALERNMSRFAVQLGQAGSGERELSRLLGAFMNENDASTALLNQRFERIAVDPYFLELQTSKKRILIPIPAEGMTQDDLPQGIRAGDTLTVDGIYMDEKDTVLHPVVIRRENAAAVQEGLTRVSGKVSDLLLPEQRSFNPLYQDSLLDDALRDWVADEGGDQSRLRSGQTVRTEWSDKWSGVRYAVLIRPLPAAGGGERYLFVLSSMQPVGEAVDILGKYVIFLTPIILLLILVLSLIYSRIVSRPLIALSRSAARLARLDFGAEPEIRSKDEFGELSRHLTLLSRNLDSALQELTEANTKLQQDVLEKQRSEQLRKELIANISHELKTPLGIVKGFAEGLQDGVAGDKKDRYLALIVSETDRMNALIMDMLELSKYEVKAVRLKPESLLLQALIQTAADSFAQQLESKGLRAELKAGEEDLRVIADPARIEQVVRNLLSNAIRHATEQSIVTVEIRRAADGRVITVVENDGPHLAEEDLARIWDHFYRAERSRDRKSGGTGLGLAIVKHILELHGSTFGARNTADGVAFYFTLQESGGSPHD